jgi:hypothetical protein
MKRTCEKICGQIRIEVAKLRYELGKLPRTDSPELAECALHLRDARSAVHKAALAVEAASKPRLPRGRPVAAGIDSPDDDEAA